jgi:hypothetical protein
MKRNRSIIKTSTIRTIFTDSLIFVSLSSTIFTDGFVDGPCGITLVKEEIAYPGTEGVVWKEGYLKF